MPLPAAKMYRGLAEGHDAQVVKPLCSVGHAPFACLKAPFRFAKKKSGPIPPPNPRSFVYRDMRAK
jgi:hypothetical protein